MHHLKDSDAYLCVIRLRGEIKKVLLWGRELAKKPGEGAVKDKLLPDFGITLLGGEDPSKAAYISRSPFRQVGSFILLTQFRDHSHLNSTQLSTFLNRKEKLETMAEAGEPVSWIRIAKRKM